VYSVSCVVNGLTSDGTVLLLAHMLGARIELEYATRAHRSKTQRKRIVGLSEVGKEIIRKEIIYGKLTVNEDDSTSCL